MYCRHACFFATEKKKRERVEISSLTTNKQTNKDKKKKKIGKYEANEKEKRGRKHSAGQHIIRKEKKHG